MKKHPIAPIKRCPTYLLPLVLLFGIASLASANVITSCQGFVTAGETLNSCTFNHNTSTLTGTVTIDETFTQTVLGSGINVGFSLTNNIAGNNVPGIFDYTVTKTIHNLSGVPWFGFNIGVPNGSSVGPVTSVSGLSACGISGTTVSCSGGSVASGSDLVVTFHIGTPTDQNSGAFALFESPVATPEPSAMALSGLGLVGLALWRRRRTVR